MPWTTALKPLFYLGFLGAAQLQQLITNQLLCR